MDLNKLSKPFTDYKWKVQTAGEYGCQCVAYLDARLVQDRLDSVVGPANWQNRYTRIGGLFCEIGIYIEGHWVWKSDIGTESQAEKVKGEASDALKRAGVQWGIGRHLYGLGLVKVPAALDKKGKWKPSLRKGDDKSIFWSNDDLTAHIKSLQDKTLVPTRKKMRAHLNKILLPLKTIEEIESQCDKMVDKYGDSILDAQTFHNNYETFREVIAPHRKRVLDISPISKSPFSHQEEPEDD
jgi:hypothetical protein